MAVVALLAATGGGCEDTSGAGLGENAVETGSPVKTFAPLVSLHSRDRALPLAADTLIASSALRWRDGTCGDATVVAKGAGGVGVEAARLGGADPYTHVSGDGADCGGGKTFATDDYTRPYDPSRANDIQIDEGFYLDLADARHGGDRPIVTADGERSVRTPVYFERDLRRSGDYTMVRLTYWMLFGLERRPGPPIAGATAYEGDWRWARVLLRTREGSNEYVPVAVRYGVRSTYVPWRSVVRTGAGRSRQTHPAVFLARGSHQAYSEPGRYPRAHQVGGRQITLYDDAPACPRCLPWRTWERLRDAREQPWYGYGGGWGASLGLGTSPSGLGPSRWADLTKDQLLPPGQIR